ncbi:hypothetical protein QYE76_001830 [Lolium multiflorum]|uniref:CCHC-type domain-containing protein n=1 Tax=Lolium multiflorum TaxID=4521 RepID=A0AAD8RLE6_LOLMU|nr:hypothetical protein QYE76_001830 [Lolium multiflorum]
MVRRIRFIYRMSFYVNKMMRKVLWKVLEGSRKVRKKPPRKVESTRDSTSMAASLVGVESQVDSTIGAGHMGDMASPINFNQFLEKEKLKSNGSNFTDWFRHVRIFLNGGNLQYVLDAPLGDPPAETETDENMNKEFPELFGMLKAVEIEIKKEHQVLMVNKTTSFKKQGKSKGKFKKGGKKAATPPMKPKNGPKPDADCYYCKEKGHWKRNCSKYLADLKSGLVKKKKEDLDTNTWDPLYIEGQGRGRPHQSHKLGRPHSGRPPLSPNPSARSSTISRTLAKLRRFSTATDTTPSSVGFKRSYYFRCPPEREVDVVFINNRTCDRVRRCCPFVAGTDRDQDLLRAFASGK